MNVVQIVKNFGPVGGMEEYVYQLSREMAAQNASVTILCETSKVDSTELIQVITLGRHRKPHWISHFRFSAKVDRWLKEHPSENRIIHSHERQNSHHITTFHTTPFGSGRRKKWLHQISPRHRLLEQLEKRELFGLKVKAVVPVSMSLRANLQRKYPSLQTQLMTPIYPGVSLLHKQNQAPLTPAQDGGTLGFIGREWKRKGLPKVVDIWKNLKQTRPDLKLCLAGFERSEVSAFLSPNEPDVHFLGWIGDRNAFYSSIDLLVHPAKQEAFGMIIAEAMTAGIPILCSSQCGAAEQVSDAYGKVLEESAALELWTDGANRLLSTPFPQKPYSRTWADVATEYLEIYDHLLNTIKA